MNANRYLQGCDVLGADIEGVDYNVIGPEKSKSFEQEVADVKYEVIGYVDILGAVDVRRMAPPQVQPALALVEHVYSVEEAAIKKGKGGMFEKSLPGEQTRKNNLELIGNVASKLRRMSPGARLSPSEWDEVRSASTRAISDWAAVNDGREYQNAVFDQLLLDVKTNAENLPAQAQAAAAAVAAAGGNLAGSVVEGATGIPPWAWKVGIGIGIVGVGYGLFRVFMTAAPAAATAYFGGRR